MITNIKIQKGTKLRDKSTDEIFAVNFIDDNYVYYMNNDAEGQVSLKNLSNEFEVITET